MAEPAEPAMYIPPGPRRRPSKTPPGAKRHASGSNASTPSEQRHGSLVSEDAVQLTVRTLDKREYQIKAEHGMLVRQLREAVAVSTGVDAENQVDPLFRSPATWNARPLYEESPGGARGPARRRGGIPMAGSFPGDAPLLPTWMQLTLSFSLCSGSCRRGGKWI